MTPGARQQLGQALGLAIFKSIIHLQNDRIRRAQDRRDALGQRWQAAQHAKQANQCQNRSELHVVIMNKSDEKKAIEKKALRKRLIEQRLRLPDRLQRVAMLQQVLRIWLVGRPDTVIGAYWPIKGEFDPLPALHRWKEDGELIEQQQLRKIGLPVVDKVHKTMRFHAWYPGCPMEEDAYGIPKPKDTEVITPTLIFVACVGYAPGGYRLGYGGGFYDRTLASLNPRPFTVGLGFGTDFLPDFEPEPHDLPMDAILNDHGVVWPV